MDRGRMTLRFAGGQDQHPAKYQEQTLGEELKEDLGLHEMQALDLWTCGGSSWMQEVFVPGVGA